MAKFLSSYAGQIGTALRGEQSPLALNLQKALVESSFDGGLQARTYSQATRRVGHSPINQFVQPIRGGKTLVQFNTDELARLFGNNRLAFPKATIGSHPDFVGKIGPTEYANHHVVSMFLDIRGSTRLVSKYSLQQIRLMKDTLLTACIYVANFFGGHVHRLQGDAAVMQFVRVGEHPNHSIINALNAASVLCYFITDPMAAELEKDGLNPLSIRVGIDYGTDEEVLWSHYGIEECGELTTTSLHTDLAAKLQQAAGKNEVRIGENVRRALDLPDEFCKVPAPDRDGTSNELIIRIDPISLRYRQYEFKWFNYLRTFEFIRLDTDGKLDFAEEPNQFWIRCDVYSESSEYHTAEGRYRANSYALPKGKGLIYTLMKGSAPYQQYSLAPSPLKVTWQIENRGAEAEEAGALNARPQADKTTTRHPEFRTGAAYLGHHYMTCKVEQSGQPARQLKFPIYVQ